MAIVVNLDVMLAKRKMSLTSLTQEVGITMSNLSILKTGKAKAIRFEALDAICRVLDCQPGDLLAYQQEELNEEERKKVKPVRFR
ncbi:XRE family transcriptional regulator [Pedobacter sp. PACM 27299]|uniref:helix-turn-helix domain-containing protein n=1 Tax=Pedobacter sp. PACM 27299 TaxID=1727164 RepID=UPI000706822C|nr:helix-turn-helix transcriptional regulator [Pedobacter sp. PACM 27299]ALL05135.1 XRE family transcriptional regulator [Pedobacter sp. PACM 27299]